jgi:hypothetical protein
MTLEGYGAGRWMVQLICCFWQDAIMVCHEAGNYGMAFKAGHGITQGGLLSAKLFNILFDAVVREWVRQLEEKMGYEDGKLVVLTATFFAIFYVDITYLASWDAGFLQRVLTLLVDLFQQVGLRTNTSKTQTMICTPGWIRTQLPTELYRRMQRGRVTSAKWNSCNVQCYQCGKGMKAGPGRCLLHLQADSGNQGPAGRPTPRDIQLELQPFYGVFLDLRKAFHAMDREQCIMTLEGYGAGPRMVRLIRGFWQDAIIVRRAAGN